MLQLGAVGTEGKEEEKEEEEEDNDICVPWRAK
jgi:hypothetical protein